jgi:hypothetical protein
MDHWRREGKFIRPATECSVKGLDRLERYGYMRAIRLRAVRGCVAQLVEQLTLNQRVTGSIPVAPTKIFR